MKERRKEGRNEGREERRRKEGGKKEKETNCMASERNLNKSLLYVLRLTQTS